MRESTHGLGQAVTRRERQLTSGPEVVRNFVRKFPIGLVAPQREGEYVWAPSPLFALFTDMLSLRACYLTEDLHLCILK